MTRRLRFAGIDWMKLNGELVGVKSIRGRDTEAMFGLMNEYYDNMRRDVFFRDLRDKDYCVLLHDENNRLKGFSTQKILRVPVGGADVYGVFSGDTIIDKSCWGSPELFNISIRFLVEYGKRFDAFYWFLISKGYKTYKILPAFFDVFYPRCGTPTPPGAKKIMDAYGALLYPGEYDGSSGVIKYRTVKDKLKGGVADMTEATLKNEHAAFFAQANPTHNRGDDLVCLAEISEENLTAFARRRILGS